MMNDKLKETRNSTLIPMT